MGFTSDWHPLFQIPNSRSAYAAGKSNGLSLGWDIFFKWSEKLTTHLHWYRNEADSYRARLKRTEQLLEESRTEFLGISDAKSQLDREVNLLKLTQTKPMQIPTG